MTMVAKTGRPGGMRGIALVGVGAALLGLAASGARANNINMSGDLLRTPMSIRELGGGGLYGSYDVFKVFSNPALLANQPTTWEYGFSNQNTFSGDQNIASIAGSYGSVQTDAGVFGVAMLASGTFAAGFDELDIYGQPTGQKISPTLIHMALAGLYQWEFVSFGVCGHFGDELFGRQDLASVSQGKMDLGTTITLGRLDLGVVYHVVPQDVAGIAFGIAFKSDARVFKGVSANLDLPFAFSANTNGNTTGSTTTTVTYQPSGYATTLDGGITLNPYHDILVRVGGLLWPSTNTKSGGGTGGVSARIGFSVPYQSWSFDYALGVPFGAVGGAGLSNVLGATWRVGAERKMSDGPKFLLGEKDRTLAVANFDPQNVSAGDAAVISDMVRNQLIKEGAFNIVEKANMDKVLGEQAFQQTGCTTQECAVKLGKVLNVKYLVVGSFGKALEQYVLSMRVIDVETAKAVYSDEAYGKNLPEVRDGITTMASNLTKAVTGKK